MAKKIRANPTLIGAFVLGGLAIAAAAIMIMGGAALFTSKQRAVVFFEGSVNGLTVGAPVNFRGVRVGSVDKIALQFDSSTLNARIPVYLTLLPDQVKLIGSNGNLSNVPFNNLIEKGLRAKLNLQSFVTGQLIIDLDFRPDTPVILVGSPDPNVPEIPTAKSDFDLLKEQLTRIPFREVADDIHRIVEAVRSVSDGTNTVLTTTNAEITATAAATRKSLEIANQTLKQLQVTLSSIKKTSDNADNSLDLITPQMLSALKRSDIAFKHADETLVKVDTTFAQIQELTSPGTPLIVNLEQTLEDLSQTANSLRNVADTLDKKPNALIFGKDDPQ